MSQELLPCPLDNGQATMTGKHLDERCGYGYEVTTRCKTCGCSVTRCNTSNDAGWNDEPSAQTEARAIAAWNTRPTAQAVAVDDALKQKAIEIAHMGKTARNESEYLVACEKALRFVQSQELQAAMGGACG